jgi:hypothetical protein
MKFGVFCIDTDRKVIIEPVTKTPEQKQFFRQLLVITDNTTSFHSLKRFGSMETTGADIPVTQ